MLGDLRCGAQANRSDDGALRFQGAFDHLKNTARPEHEKDMILSIEGYFHSRRPRRSPCANNEPANLDVVILGELRVLVGLGRQTNG